MLQTINVAETSKIYIPVGKSAKIWEEHIHSINVHLLGNSLSEKVQVIQISKIKYCEFSGQ